MEKYEVTNLQVVLKNDELVKYDTLEKLKGYINEVVVPAIHRSITTAPKGGSVDVRCDRSGCSVGGTFRF